MAHAERQTWSGTAPCGAEDGPLGKPTHYEMRDPALHLVSDEGRGRYREGRRMATRRRGREDDEQREARSMNASNLSFPLQMVIYIAVGVAGAVSGNWIMRSGDQAAQAQTQSDVRNIGTMISGQNDTAKVQRELDKERSDRAAEKAQANIDALRSTVDSIQKEQRLMQVEFQNFRESVLAMQGRRQP